MGTGVGSILPILPLFLRERAASYALIGVVVSANLVAQVVGQYPAGRLSDRFGRRPMMLGGLLVYAAAVSAFVLPVPVWWLIALRFVQGLGAAAFGPGSRATVADLVPAEEWGMAYGWVSGARMSGLIVGPALGGVLALFGRATVFEVTGLAVLVAAVVVWQALPSRKGGEAMEGPVVFEDDSTGLVGPRGRNALAGILSVAFGIGFLFGVYDVVWSLFMRSIGANDWQVGASFSLFALPLVITAPAAGWAADRWDRRWPAVGSGAVSAMLAPLYPWQAVSAWSSPWALWRGPRPPLRSRR